MSDSYIFTGASEDASNKAAATAPESGGTAPAENANNEAQAGQEGGPDEQKEPKTFTQEDVDRIAQRERETAYRKARRDLEAQAQEANRPANSPPPKREQFAAGAEGDQAFFKAAVDHAADVKLLNEQQNQQQATVDQAFQQRLTETRAKYDDFDAVVQNPTLKVSEAMADAIAESDLGAEIAYYLGKNPAEAARIAGLSTPSQMREIGLIEAKLNANPPARKVSSAPEPITPLKGTPPTVHKFTPDDPRSDKMDMDTWAAARLKQMSGNR